MEYIPFSFKKFLRSFAFASKGVVNLFKNEQNARFHIITGVFVGAFAYFIGVTRIEATILFFAFVSVLTIEIINTAIEKLLDLIHPESHRTIEYIKDAMAGAVLIASIIALVVGILIFYPHFNGLF
jgi:diacylglycerol kinase